MDLTKLFLSALVTAAGNTQTLLASNAAPTTSGHSSNSSTPPSPWDNYLDAAEIIVGTPTASVFYELLLKNSANASKALQANRFVSVLDLNKGDMKSIFTVVGTYLSTYFNDDNFCGTSARARGRNTFSSITLRYCIKACLAMLAKSTWLQATQLNDSKNNALQQTEPINKKLALQSALKATVAATLSCIYFTPALGHASNYFKQYQAVKDLSPGTKVLVKSLVITMGNKIVYAIHQYFKERNSNVTTKTDLAPKHTAKKIMPCPTIQ